MQSNRNIKLLAWFNFFTDFKLYAGITIIYFTQVTGSLTLGMSIFAISNIADAIFEVPTGMLSDMVGRKKTVVFGALASITYAIFYAIGGSFWMLALGAVFQGLSVAFYSGNNDALLHDSLLESGQSHRYHDYLGKLSSLFQVALGVGTLLGAILATNSFALIMWLSVIPQVICLTLSLFLKEPTVHVEKSTNVYAHLKDALKLFITNKKLRTLSIASMIGGSLGEVQYQFQAAFYQLLWPLWAIGVAKMLSNIGATISFYFSGRIIDRFDEMKVVLAGNIYSRVINTISVLIPTQISPLLMSSTSLLYGANNVAKNSLFQKLFTPHQRATLASLNSLGESILMAFFSVLLGAIGDLIGAGKTFFIAQLIALIATYLYWKVFKDQKAKQVT